MYGSWTEIQYNWDFLGFIWDLWDVLTVHITSLVDAIRILALVRLARPSMLIVPTVLVWISFKFVSPESKFNEFEPCLKSAKNRFQLSAGINIETLDTILSGTNHIWAAFQI